MIARFDCTYPPSKLQVITATRQRINQQVLVMVLSIERLRQALALYLEGTPQQSSH